MTDHAVGGATAILVLGMHRSGTSAVTRVLNLLGAHVGDELLAAKADNKHGFWEHSEAVAIHERLLASLGRSWHDTRELPDGWLESPAGKSAVEEISALIERDMRGRSLWAIKDPRMCRLAPAWIEALRAAGMRASAVLVVREPHEVASSLHVRDGWTYPHAYLMWAQHLLDAFRATTGIPRALLSYDQLMGDWPKHVARLGSALGVVWRPGIEQATPAIEAFLTPDERHHHASRLVLDLPRDDLPPPYLNVLYQACVASSQDAGWERLAELDRHFTAVSALFAGPMDEITRERDDANRHGSEQEALALERIERIHQLEAELRSVTGERGVLEALAIERIERIHQMEAALSLVARERGAFEAIAQERIGRIQQLESELAVRVTETQQVQEQLERLLSLAGSRWWAFKRVLRPARPTTPGSNTGSQ